jgi:CrcB protein
MKWLYLIFGGILGTVARYLFSGAIYKVFGTAFPYGTLAVNMLGCFLIGIFAALSDKKLFFDPNMRLFLMIGFCGAFTTFSTLILESANLIKDSQAWLAFLNISISVILGFLVFWLGFILGEVI